LFRRGDVARSIAQANADRIAGWAMGELGRWFSFPSDVAVGSLAIAHVGTPEDISARLFASTFVEHLQAAATALPAGAAMPQAPEWTQYALLAPVASPDLHDRSGAVVATWHGVTGVAFGLAGITQANPDLFVNEHVQAAWLTAAGLQSTLGGFGESFVTILMHALPLRAVRSVGPSGHVEVRRGPLASEYDLDLQLASVKREVTRASRARIRGRRRAGVEAMTQVPVLTRC